MKIKIKAVCMVLALVLISSQVDLAFAATDKAGTDIDAQAMLENGDYKEDELIVVFDESVSDKKIENVAEKNDAEVDTIDVTADDQKMCQVSLDDTTTMEEAIEDFADNPSVEYVQPNYKYEINAQDPLLVKGSKRYSYQLEAVNAEKAWTEVEKKKPAKPATVAIIDTGVYTEHEDLSKNLVKTEKGNYVSFREGRMVYSKDDTGDHGTHCAGIVGAVYGNGIGTAGVASGHKNDLVRVMMVGSSPDGGSLYTSDIVRAMRYIMNWKKANNIKVVSMSFGIRSHDELVHESMYRAYNNGLTLLAASGNEDTDEMSYPAAFPEVISVNASHRNGSAMYFSNYGKSCDISAPGDLIYSTLPEASGYGSKSGTSMATPCAAAVAALILDANPSLAPAQVRNILCTTTKEKAKPFDAEGLAYGNIDALAAVKAAKTGSGSVTKIDVKCPKTEIAAGEETCIQAVTYGGYSKATFKSNNGNVKVDSHGTVEGIKAGKSNITVTAGGKSETVEITVTGEQVDMSKLNLKAGVEEIDKNKNGYYELAAGEITFIYAFFTKKDDPDTEVEAEYITESSDPDVLFVSDTMVQANKKGRATVTVSDKKRSKKVTIKFEVKNGPKKISVSEGPACVKVGRTGVFKATLTPVKKGEPIANSKCIEWSTSNSKRAVSAGNGRIKCRKPGKVYVLAQYSPPNMQYNYENVGLIKTAKKQIIVYDKLYSGKKAYNFRQSGKLKKRIKLRWKRVPRADGYIIYKAAKKNGKYKKVKTVTKGSTTGVTLKTKKNGYYKIRAYYKMDNGTKRFGNFKLSNRIYGKVKR